MARQNIAALLGNVSQAEEPEPSSPSIEVMPSPMSKTPVTGGGPLYLTLERKETRLRVDQYQELTRHARRLNRAKGTGGDRITENTLIRIAIDLLVPLLDEASGQDETQIRESVSSRVR